jgi:hypothetical protein
MYYCLLIPCVDSTEIMQSTKYQLNLKVSKNQYDHELYVNWISVEAYSLY